MSQRSDEFREASQQLQVIQAQIQELTQEREALRTTLEELRGAVEALEHLESGSTVQVPLGGSAYVRAEIQEIDEVIVSIGSGFSAEQPRDGAISTLQERQAIVEGRIETITETLGELQSEGTEIEQQMQQLAQEQQVTGGPSGIDEA